MSGKAGRGTAGGGMGGGRWVLLVRIGLRKFLMVF